MRNAAYIILQIAFVFAMSEAKLSIIEPQPANSFNVSSIKKNVGSCSYTVEITTSCTSTRYTRDQISISFGDAYGNQIYAPRLDDPASRAFEQCSSDTFQINGPCSYQICYVYLYRTGPDGWKPDTVKIYGYSSKAVSFYYGRFIPSDTWYGFNMCNAAAASSHNHVGQRWLAVIIGLVFALSLSSIY